MVSKETVFMQATICLIMNSVLYLIAGLYFWFIDLDTRSSFFGEKLKLHRSYFSIKGVQIEFRSWLIDMHMLQSSHYLN